MILALLGDVDCQRHERPVIERDPIDSVCVSHSYFGAPIDMADLLIFNVISGHTGESYRGYISHVHTCYDHDRCESEENSWRKWKCRAY